MLLLNINIIIIEKVEVSSEIFSFYFWNFLRIHLSEQKQGRHFPIGGAITQSGHPYMGTV